MSKKHFQAVAAVIKSEIELAKRPAGPSYAPALVASLTSVARELASTFAGFNPHFDRGRFLRACGVE